jgi:hypothetical protein
MRYIWQAILHRWYMGYWPTREIPQPRQAGLLAQGIIVIDEVNWGRKEMDQYIDPVIHQEINKFLADVLEE